MTKVLVLYYSSWGHMEAMAQAAAKGAREAGADVTVKRVPELVPEDVAKAAHYKLDQDAPVAVVDEQAAQVQVDAVHLVGRMLLLPEDLGHHAEHGAAVELEPAVVDGAEIPVTELHRHVVFRSGSCHRSRWG